MVFFVHLSAEGANLPPVGEGGFKFAQKRANLKTDEGGTAENPSSVTKIGSEEPLLVTASPQGEAFGRSRAKSSNEQPAKRKFEFRKFFGSDFIDKER